MTSNAAIDHEPVHTLEIRRDILIAATPELTKRAGSVNVKLEVVEQPLASVTVTV